MTDYNSWISLVLSVLAGLALVGFVVYLVAREWLLNRHITRVQPTTAEERELAASIYEYQRMVRGQATRIAQPIREIEPSRVIDLDALQA